MSSDFDPLARFEEYIYIIRALVLAVLTNFPKTWNKHFLYATT